MPQQGSLSPSHDEQALSVESSARIAHRRLRRREPSVKTRRREQELMEELDRHRAVLDTLSDAVLRCLPDGTLTFVNQTFRTRFGMKAGQPLDRRRLRDIFPGDYKLVEIALSTLSHDHPSVSIESPGAHWHGRPVWNQWTVTAVYGPDGGVREYQITGRDVTAFKAAEERLRNSLADKEALLGEIHHRVKNNLQIISSILDLIGMESDDSRITGIIGDARARIHTMALIHSQLMKSDRVDQIDLRRHVTELTDYLFHIHENGRNRITTHFDIDDVFLNMDMAVPFGLALYEMLSNSFKHAFPHEREGKILVRFTAEPGWIHGAITDTGIGFPLADMDNQPGKFGMRLIRLIICEQLGGTLHISGSHGAEYRITFPV